MEIFNSFFNNIKDKLTNPFFGTLLLVLLIHHWELWYTIFNFDSDCYLNDKIVIIENYILKNLTFTSLLWDIVKSFFLMLIGYLIIVATRSLVIWIEFGLMPYITGKIVNKNVVRKIEYDEVVKEREQYFDQYEEQRKNVRTFSKTIDEQTEQIKQKDETIFDQSELLGSNNIEINNLTGKLNKSLKENEEKQLLINQINSTLEQVQQNLDFKILVNEKYEHLFFDKENQIFYSSIEKFPPEIVNKVKELKKENQWNLFLSLGNFLENGGTIGGEALSKMIEKDVAFERGSREDLTPIGRVIWKYRKIFDSTL